MIETAFDVYITFCDSVEDVFLAVDEYLEQHGDKDSAANCAG